MDGDRTLQGTSADAVVVGGGTVGAWCATFLRRAGLGRVVLLEASTLGQGASSRAAGIVRSQGGTPTAVRLAEWSRHFYRTQHEAPGSGAGPGDGLGASAGAGFDVGFVRQGYYLPCFSPADVVAARTRLGMQQALGQAVRWVDADEAETLNPTLAPGSTLGGTFLDDDGYIHPPRNVLASTVALVTTGVDVFERTTFEGLVTAGGRVVGVETSRGRVTTAAVVLTGGPQLADVGRRAGTRIPAGGVRHQVAVTAPHPDLDPSRLPMVFDVAAGLYWRPEEGGLLFGMSNPDEQPGEADEVDWPYLERMRQRLSALVPVTASLGLRRVWAATIDYTPDHLPILGPVLGPDGPVTGTVVASAGGHGMMWGPAVSRAAADLLLTGSTDVVDAGPLGLDRFDEHGRSRLDPDPIALPFPEQSSGH